MYISSNTGFTVFDIARQAYWFYATIGSVNLRIHIFSWILYISKYVLVCLVSILIKNFGKMTFLWVEWV